MPTKILVTGGAGFIGSNFIRHLLAARPSTHVVNFDKLTYAGNLRNLTEVSKNPRYSFIKGDICDAKSVASAMFGCDAIIHFAAESHVDRSIDEPYASLRTNFHGTFTLLQAARAKGIPRFLHISTDEVYGDIPPLHYSDEHAPLRPNNPYAASKAGADLLVGSFARTYNYSAIIARPSNNYGPYQFPEKFIPLMIASALDGKPLPIYGDGQHERDWLHVDDNCSALLKILEDGKNGESYNIGAGNIQKNLSVARSILQLTAQPESLLTHIADRPGHDRRYALDSTKLQRELNWKPQITFEDALRDTIAWYRDNPKWLAEVRSGEYAKYYAKHYGKRTPGPKAAKPRKRK